MKDDDLIRKLASLLEYVVHNLEELARASVQLSLAANDLAFGLDNEGRARAAQSLSVVLEGFKDDRA